MNNYSFTSSDGHTKVYTRFFPINNIKGIIVLVHGLGDHIDNYEDIANILKDEGYAIAGIDLIGFGKSSDIYGYYEDRKNTYNYFTDDLKTYIDKLQEEYKDIPIYLLGFSFGSFITRLYINKYDNVKGMIVIGSAFINPTYMNFCKFYASCLAVGKGWNDRNTFLYHKTIVKLNDRFEDKSIPSWLCSNISFIRSRINDPYVSARLTTSGYYVLYDVINKCCKKKNVNAINKNLPILILSGKDDPVTSFGKDVYLLDKRYKENNVMNVRFKIYNNMRHDLLHEVSRDIPIHEILEFLNNK
jgi:alpha-beta hydrolase superfamily lysophospholipase